MDPESVRRVIVAFLLLGTLSGLALADGYVAAELRVAEKPDMSTQRAVIFHRNGTEVLIVESPFRGQGDRFGWLLPVPSEPTRVLPADPRLFAALFGRFQPKITDIGREGLVLVAGTAIGLALLIVVLYLLARWKSFFTRMLSAILIILAGSLVTLTLLTPSHLGYPEIPSAADPEVRRLRVGAYDTAILKPRTVEDLQDWLSRNGFAPMPAAGQQVAQAVIRDGWWFIASQLRREAPGTDTRLTPQPVEVHFSAPFPVYPLRLTALASEGLDLDLIVVAGGRAVAGPLEPIWCGRFRSETPASGSRVMSNNDFGERTGNPILLRNGWEGCCLTRLQGKLPSSRLTADLRVEIGETSAFRKVFYTVPAAFVNSFGLPVLGVFLFAMAVVLVSWDERVSSKKRKVYRRVFLSVCCLSLAGGCALYLTLEKIGPSRVVRLSEAHRQSAIAILRFLMSAEMEYSASPYRNGAYGSLQDLARAGKLDHRFLEPNPVIDRYIFSSNVTRTGFTILATGPSASPEWNLLVREDGLVRMSDETPVE